MPIRQRYQYQPQGAVLVEGARVGRLNMGINSTFIVYRIGETLIDSGPSNQWSHVRRFIDERPVSRLLLSHHHEDHSGNAASIASYCELMPMAPELARDKLVSGYATPLLQKAIWGSPQPVQTELLPAQLTLKCGRRLQAIHTPGHAKDLHCFYFPDQGWLFSGDLYISKSLRYLRSDEDLQQLMDSIRKVLALEFDTLFCPHRGILEDGKPALQAKLDNIVELCERARELQSQGLSRQKIIKRLLGPEDLMSYLTRFNFSKGKLIDEALRCE